MANLPTDEQLTSEEAAALIREAVATSAIGFQCCFCHECMEDDVCAVILVTNWEKPEVTQRSQQWFCHDSCFARVTGERVEVLEPEV